MSDLPYDPAARRDTPLARMLAARIRREGPIPIDAYMRACLADPEHGYYRTRTAVGRAGDFITAPEISQVFGELIGLWSAIVWRLMGSPPAFSLVELGPGRGTMMQDALRAARIVPGFLEAATVVLVDVAPTDTLRSELARTLPHSRIRASRLSDIDSGKPAIVLANEFLDTCPLSQIEIAEGRSHVRGVGLDAEGRLTYVRMRAAAPTSPPAPAIDGIFEAQDWSVLGEVRRLLSAGGAALFIDYGHFDPARGEAGSGPADTLQAVRSHRPEHPLTSPGEADLTCQVDFNAVRRRLSEHESDGPPALAVDGPATQAEFLGSLGIMERASRLMAANPAQAAAIEAGVARLMAVPGMGNRFLAIGARVPSLPALPGFELAPRKC